jgi:cytochrome c
MRRAAVVIATGMAAAFFQSAAYAQVDAKKAEALAKQSTCLNCHAVSAKKVGPAFKDVAAKGKAAGADKVIANLKAQPVHQASVKATKDGDLKTIVNWILSL